MRIGIDASRAFGKERTGTENYSWEMIRHILALPEAKKDEIILYVRTPPPPSLIKEVDRGDVRVRVVVIPLSYLWTQLGLAWRTWIDKLDVLWVPAHTLPILRNPWLKTVVTIHGIEYEWLPAYENKLQRWYLPLSTMYAVRNADKIIAVSEFTKKQLSERLKADSYRIEVVHEGVASQAPRYKIQETNKLKNQILKKYELENKKYLVFIGTVQPRKNLERLIEAFSHLTPTHLLNSGDGNLEEVLKLVIVGKLGWNYEAVITAPKRLGVEDKVKLIGYVDDSERDILLQSALAYVQPSITEGFGLPIVEAWQAGVPVVSSDGGALKEVLGDAGLLFDPLDVNDMINKLETIINNPKLRRDLIAKGRKRVGDFNWVQASHKTYNILTAWK